MEREVEIREREEEEEGKVLARWRLAHGEKKAGSMVVSAERVGARN